MQVLSLRMKMMMVMMVVQEVELDSLTGPVYDLTTNDHGVAENGPYLIMGDGSTNHPFAAYLADVNDDGTIGDQATDLIQALLMEVTHHPYQT